MENVLPKHKGVAFDKRRNYWFSTIKLHGQNKYLGSFTTFESAVSKRLEAEKTYRAPIKLERLRFEENIIND
jgi:hypothetical protein